MDGQIIIAYIVVLIIPAYASFNINKIYKKYKSINNKKEKSGFEIARIILENHELEDNYIIENPGNFNDCYVSARKTIKLSTDVFHGESLWASAVAAYECGYATEDKENYSYFKIKNALKPFVSSLEASAYIFLILGFILELSDLFLLALCLTGLSLIFELVTLPIEFETKKRAIKYLKELKLVNKKEEEHLDEIMQIIPFSCIAEIVMIFPKTIKYLLSFLNRS